MGVASGDLFPQRLRCPQRDLDWRTSFGFHQRNKSKEKELYNGTAKLLSSSSRLFLDTTLNMQPQGSGCVWCSDYNSKGRTKLPLVAALEQDMLHGPVIASDGSTPLTPPNVEFTEGKIKDSTIGSCYLETKREMLDRSGFFGRALRANSDLTKLNIAATFAPLQSQHEITHPQHYQQSQQCSRSVAN
eukprot:3502819-Amphidinium_carterae.1